MFAFLFQVFQPQTPSVQAEAGQGGVGGGPKGQEAGQSPEGKDAGASRPRAARRLWRERWLVLQRHQQQRMLLMVTVFLKVSSYCAHLYCLILLVKCPLIYMLSNFLVQCRKWLLSSGRMNDFLQPGCKFSFPVAHFGEDFTILPLTMIKNRLNSPCFTKKQTHLKRKGFVSWL